MAFRNTGALVNNLRPPWQIHHTKCTHAAEPDSEDSAERLQWLTCAPHALSACSLSGHGTNLAANTLSAIKSTKVEKPDSP